MWLGGALDMYDGTGNLRAGKEKDEKADIRSRSDAGN